MKKLSRQSISLSLFTSFISFLRNSPYWMDAWSAWKAVRKLILIKCCRRSFEFLRRSSFRCITDYKRTIWSLFKHLSYGNNTGVNIVQKIGNSFLFNWVPSLQCLRLFLAAKTELKFHLFLVNIFLVQINLTEIFAKHTAMYNVMPHNNLHQTSDKLHNTYMESLVPEFGILPKKVKW